MFKPVIPVGYLFSPDRAGNCYVGTMRDRPPCAVRPVQYGDQPEKTQIVLEFENIMGMVGNDLLKSFGIERENAEEVLRLAMHVPDARQLCVHLITALADAGDPIAGKIRISMYNAMRDRDKEQADEQNGDASSEDS